MLPVDVDGLADLAAVVEVVFRWRTVPPPPPPAGLGAPPPPLGERPPAPTDVELAGAGMIDDEQLAFK
jgi:hypothetical protein